MFSFDDFLIIAGVVITASCSFVTCIYIVTGSITCHPKPLERVMYEQQVNEKGEIYFIQVENN
jgi:hypothetical protein